MLYKKRKREFENAFGTIRLSSPLPLLDPLLMPLAGADRRVGVLIPMDQKPAPLACLPITMRMPFPCQSCSLAFNSSTELEAHIHVCSGSL